MQTRTALALHDRAPRHEWGDGPLGKVATQLLESFQAREAERLDRAHDAAQLAGAGPALAALQRRFAEASAQDLFDIAVPMATRFDLFQVLKSAAQELSTDRGLKTAVKHAEMIWHRDPHGVVAVGDVARFRAHYQQQFPKSAVTQILDEVLPTVGFNTLPVQKLAAMAANIRGDSQDELELSYSAIVNMNGLSSNQPEHVRARAYLRGLVNLAEDENQHTAAATTGGDAAVERTLSRMATGDDAILRSVTGAGGDDPAMDELDIYLENTSELYNQKKSIIENLKRKMKRGVYDPALAPKLWMYWVDAGAKRYAQEFGSGNVREIFPRQLRAALAEELARRYQEAIQRGEYGPIEGKQAQMEESMDGAELPAIEEEVPHDEASEAIVEVDSPITGEPLVLELGSAETEAEDEMAFAPGEVEGLEHFGQLGDFEPMDDVPMADEGAGETTTTIEDPSAPGEMLDITLTPAGAGEDDGLGDGMLPPAPMDVPLDAHARKAFLQAAQAAYVAEKANGIYADPTDKTAVAPEGWEGTVQEMKNDKDVDNPWALAWWMKNKGYESHKGKSKSKKSFLVYAVRGGVRGREPLDRVEAESMPRALGIIAKRLAEIGDAQCEVRASAAEFQRHALITLDAELGNHLYVTAEESGTEFEPEVNAQQPAQVKVPEDGAAALASDGGFSQPRSTMKPDVSTGSSSVKREAKPMSAEEVRNTAASLGLTADAIEAKLLSDEPVTVGAFTLLVNASGDVELQKAGKKVIAKSIVEMDGLIASFMARVAAEKGVAPIAKSARYDVRPLFLVGCQGCGGLDEYLMPDQPLDVKCARCGTDTPARVVAMQLQARQVVPGYVLVTDVPGDDSAMNARRLLIAVREVSPSAEASMREDGRLEISLRAVDERALARIQNVLESKFGVQHQTLKTAQAQPDTLPSQESPPTMGVQVAPQQQPPAIAPTYTPPTPAVNPPIGMAQPIAPQVQKAPGTPPKQIGPTTPPAQPGISVQMQAPGQQQQQPATTPVARAASIYKVAFKGMDGRPRSVPVEARDEATARRIFASYHADTEVISVTAQEAPAAPPPAAEAPAAPPVPPEGGMPMDMSAPTAPMGGMAISPQVKEAIGAAMLTYRNSGIDAASGVQQFQSKFRQLVERFGDESSPARQALGAEIIRAAQEAWARPALLELTAQADEDPFGRFDDNGDDDGDEDLEGFDGTPANEKMRIELDNQGSEPGSVLVTCDDAEAAQRDQSIRGSMWENADGMAYAIISDEPGLVEALEADGYDVYSANYAPADDAGSEHEAARVAGEGGGKMPIPTGIKPQQPPAVAVGKPNKVLGPDSEGADPKVMSPKVKKPGPMQGTYSNTDMGGGEEDKETKFPGEKKPPANGQYGLVGDGTSLTSTDLGDDSQNAENSTTKKWDSVSKGAPKNMRSK